MYTGLKVRLSHYDCYTALFKSFALTVPANYSVAYNKDPSLFWMLHIFLLLQSYFTKLTRSLSYHPSLSKSFSFPTDIQDYPLVKILVSAWIGLDKTMSLPKVLSRFWLHYFLEWVTAPLEASYKNLFPQVWFQPSNSLALQTTDIVKPLFFLSLLRWDFMFAPCSLRREPQVHPVWPCNLKCMQLLSRAEATFVFSSKNTYLWF